MHITGAALVTTLLDRQGITTVPGIPGGATLPLYDALAASPIRHVLARHEQGGGFIAQGMARATGQAAVCIGTSGPGATNLLTAIADAKLDSVPLIAITGQVPRAMIGTDAFQEIDTYGLTVPISKHNYLVRSAGELLDVIPDAFRIATSGRPGPVVIDIPKDVQTESIAVDRLPEPGRPDPPPRMDGTAVAAAADLVRAAARPLFLVGAGVIAAGAAPALRRLAERLDVPVASTLLGLGTLPAGHPLDLGMVGMHAAPCTNLALEACDLLIAVGMRFDDRATGKLDEFCPDARVIHIDIDPSEIGKLRHPTCALVADAGLALDAVASRLPPMARPVWRARVDLLRERHPLRMPGLDDPCSPYGIVRHAAALLGPDAVVTSDVGQHQMWAAQAYPFSRPRQWLTSGGLGTMGFGLPAAIGAALAHPGVPIVCFTGDGSLLMNVQELATLAEEDLPVKIVLLDNGHLGLVRQQQQLFYGARYSASRFRAEPDFPAIARGFGVAAWDLATTREPLAMLARALGEPGPALVRVPIAPDANVYPMVPPGAPNRHMIEEASDAR